MADARQLKQDLAVLETATAELSDNIDSAYQAYFKALSESLRRQVVSACYNLCTKGYPEQFLALSFDRREQLQQAIQQAIARRNLALSSPEDLLQATEERRHEVEQMAREAADAVIEALEAAAEEGVTEGAETIVVRSAPAKGLGLNLGLTIRAAQQREADQAADANAEEVEAEGAETNEVDIGADAGTPVTAATTPAGGTDIDGSETTATGAIAESPTPEPVTPLTLLDQWEAIDSALTYLVEALTDDLNGLLRKAKIIPPEMPEAVMEAILKAGSAEMVDAPPNILSLEIHTDEYEGDEPIVAVRLQISELEFNDTGLSAARSRLRERYSALKKLGRRYQANQRDRTQMEAESAWRAAWHDLA